MKITIKSIRSKMLIFLTHEMALPLLQKIRKPEFFPYRADDLKNFAPGTLGHDLVQFLQQRNLQLLPYYAKHDIKHVLLGYDTTDEGEVCLQCFMLGNGHLSFPVAATVFYGLLTMPGYWGSFMRAHRRGKKCTSLSNWPWHQVVFQQTRDLQKKIDNF